VTESISPDKPEEPELRFQPSMLSVPSAASTVKPEAQPPTNPGQPQRGARRKLWFFTALAVMAGTLGALAFADTPRISTQVHSGSPGFKKTKHGDLLHWQTSTLRIYLDDSLKRIEPTAGGAVMQAFGRWVENNPKLPDLSFDTGKTSATPAHDGKSTVSYARITAPGHEQDLAITVTYSNQETGEIIEADIVLNSVYPIGVLTTAPKGQQHDPSHGGSDRGISAKGGAGACENRYDLQNVTTHEVGHFFGLGEDLVEPKAAMFSTIDRCETHKRELSATDLDAMSTLYTDTDTDTETETETEETAVAARACSFVGAPLQGGLGWVSALVVGLGLLGRRRSARCAPRIS
jgi:hypothetical protein